MARIIMLDSTFTDATLPKFQSISLYEKRIKALPGMLGWWDATNPAYYTVVGGKINHLTDRSGLGKHAVQATDATRPTVSANAFKAGVNGALLAGAQWLDAPSVFDGASEVTLVQYFKTTDTSTIRVPSGALSSAVVASYVSSAAQFVAVNGAIALAMQSLNVSASTILVADAASALLDVNSTTGAVAAPPANLFPAVNVGMSIGSYQAGHTFPFVGLIGHIMVFKNDLRKIAGAVQLLKDYAAYKYS